MRERESSGVPSASRVQTSRTCSTAPFVISWCGPVLAQYDADALAHEIVRNLAHLDEAASVHRASLENRGVERVREPGLQTRVAGTKLEYPLAGDAIPVIAVLDGDHTFGQRARLVGAENVDAAEVLDGTEPTNQHTTGSQHLRAAGEVDREDCGQSSRAQAHCEGDGKEQCFDDRPPVQRADRKHRARP